MGTPRDLEQVAFRTQLGEMAGPDAVCGKIENTVFA